MNILYIWDSDYPWDIRVEKICKSLQKAGHEVHIVARNLKKLNEYELIEGIHVHRLKKWANNKINYMVSFPAFFSPFWKNLIWRIITRYGIELIIVRDLPMAIAGIWAGEKYNIPIVFDMAEDYCSMLQEIWKIGKFKGLNLLVRNPYFARLVENYAIRKFQHIFVVIEEAKYLLEKKGIRSEAITIISNTPILFDFKRKSNNMPTNIEFIRKRYSVIYTGGITKDRGLSIVVDAMPRIIKEIKDFLFVVIGKGYESENILKSIDEKGLKDYTLWLGWVEHKNIYEYIASSKIGLIPHHVNDHINTTIPNKIFDYMMCGIPVLSSDAIPMRRILEEEKCGKVFRNGNANDLANALILMYKNQENHGINGLKAIKHKYNWEIDERKLIDVINTFQNKR